MVAQKRIFIMCMGAFLTLIAFSVKSPGKDTSPRVTIELEISGQGEIFTHKQTVAVNKQSGFVGLVRGRREQREIIFNPLVEYNRSKTKFILHYQVELQGSAGSVRPQLQIDGQIETLSGKKMTVLDCGGWKVNIKILGGGQPKSPASLSNYLLKADVICSNGRVSYKGMTTLDSQIQYIGMLNRNEFVLHALIARDEKNKKNLTFQYSVSLYDRNTNATMLQSRGESVLLPGHRKTLQKNQGCQLQVQVDGVK